ncbi:HipA family kinase [Pseudonocardia lutea]|uniref:HipA family kinase n=1 Tax=Pseudonocardia lutea TaxID=2172015 RepID=A0ABW1IB43_9PSEU
MLRHVTATRYVTPLREGGSLPGLMEADDLGTYVVKFHGAGQGRKVLVAEIVAGELARALGLPVPELVTVDLDPELGLAEPDQEVQDLLHRSAGLNLGLDYLPGALDFDPLAFDPGPGFAGRVLWFDALVGNVDRSWRNANMLLWHRAPYLIDHGATLTFHHGWAGALADPAAVAARPFDAGDHVLLGSFPDLDAADAALAPQVSAESVRRAAAAVPDEWLAGEPGFDHPDEVRAAYAEILTARVAAREAWLPAVREAAATGRPRPITRTGRPPAWLAARLPKVDR